MILSGRSKYKGWKISKYNGMYFKPEQMREIRRGLLDGLDVGRYADPRFSSRQMRKIRKNSGNGNGLKGGKDDERNGVSGKDECGI